LTGRQADRASMMCVVGARPNYMKVAPLMHAFQQHPALGRPVLVHTGQHYDVAMNQRLFEDLGLPAPDVNLEAGSGTHAQQTAEVMRRFEPVLEQHAPACVIVVGDVNSTLACSLVAVKRDVAVVHVEAGLRSFDRRMPEEINRLLTDQIAALLFTTERSAHDNLAREGVPEQRIRFVGNVMIDSLRTHLPRAPAPAQVLERAGLPGSLLQHPVGYAVATLHRPANVDSAKALKESLAILRAASRHQPLVCALHPRTRANLDRFALGPMLSSERIVVLPPQGYLEMLGLMAHAALVLTDSGGIQEETTALGVPCLTLRDSTERPITIEQGTNTLVGRDAELALSTLHAVLEHGGKRGRTPELWDGNAAQRIAGHMARWLGADMMHVAA
jgi:UDP-N-acetylglucosamine 2-epimerase (non-hydrolysing)